LPIGSVPGSESAWIFIDAFEEFYRTALYAGVVLGGLLVLVSWGIWRRRWWARRAVLGWCALVIVAFGLDVVMAARAVTAAAKAETEFALRLLSHFPALALLRRPLVNLATILFALPTQTTLTELFTLFLSVYFVVVGCFPALAAVIFGRPGARKYFKAR
jgi:hypothetical protein